MTRPERRARAGHRGPAAGSPVPWGVGAAVLYVITAAVAMHGSPGPARVLYDGLTPLLPYRWSHPPLELARDNQPPAGGQTTLPLTAGSPPGSETTDDGQASVIFDANTVAPARGDSAIQVSIVPLDPAAVAPAPPGTRFDGNAYRIDAWYIPSRTPVRLRAPAAVVLRFATGATRLVRATGTGWTVLPTLTYPGNLQLVVAKSEVLGTFAPVAPKSLPYTQSSRWWIYAVAGVAVLIAVLIGYTPRILARLRGRVADTGRR